MEEACLIPNIGEKIDLLNNVNKFILLLLGARDYAPVSGEIYLQKEMFLLQNLFPVLKDETDYRPYLLGPHSNVVEEKLNELISSNLIMSETGKIKLTPRGVQVFDILRTRSTAYEIQKVGEFKELLNDMTRHELLVFTYFSYPSQMELEKESTEYKDLLHRRKQLAVSIYLKDKVSAQKAAQIAGMYLEDFLEELKNVP